MLDSLAGPLFNQLGQVDLEGLSLNTVLLLALVLAKKAGDLSASASLLHVCQ